MRCGISCSTNRSSPGSSRDRSLSALATSSRDITSKTRSSPLKSSRIGSEKHHLTGLEDRQSAHLHDVGAQIRGLVMPTPRKETDVTMNKNTESKNQIQGGRTDPRKHFDALRDVCAGSWINHGQPNGIKLQFL
jgi:hypothetical protein